MLDDAPPATGPRVSVVLCTHNGSAHVAEQVRSILEQDVPVDELIVSDDDSSDESVRLVRETVSGAPREVHLTVRVNRPALGVARNFEQALGLATGDVVLLCDQDDRWHPHKVGQLVAALTDDSVLLVASDARLVDAHGRALGRTLSEAQGITAAERDLITAGRALEVLVRRNVVTGATVAIRRRLIEAATPVPADWLHDEWLGMVAASTGALRLDRQVLVDYRQHGGNQVGVGRTRRAKLELLRQPRSSRNDRLLRRARVLVERFEEMDVQPTWMELARGKLEHERRRHDLPAARPSRILSVGRMLVTGQYARYGLGRRDAVRDLLQPAR